MKMNVSTVRPSGHTASPAAPKVQETVKSEPNDLARSRFPAVEDIYVPSDHAAPRHNKLSAEAVKSLKEHAEQTLNGLVEKMIRAQRNKHQESRGLDLSSLAQAMGLGSESTISDIQNVVDGLQLDINVSEMSCSDIAKAIGIGTTPESAARAVSEDGMWGVNAVSTRLLDMAMRLSGGDTEKAEMLRDAVKKGFEAVDALASLPQVCQDTYAETMARFDYWEANGSLDGYGHAE